MNKHLIQRNALINFFVICIFLTNARSFPAANVAATSGLTLTPVAEQTKSSDPSATNVLPKMIKAEQDKNFPDCSVASPARKLVPFEKGERWGYKNKRGNIVIPAQFIIAEDFSKEGIAAVLDDQGWAYIDGKGCIVIKPFIFDNGPDYFKEGLARFTINGKLGFFDKAGKVIIEPQFDFVEPFHEGLAAACMGCRSESDGEHSIEAGGFWGYIDRKGKIVISLRFESAEDFENEKARVKLNGKWSYIDKRGRVLE